jgi:hypothetical protein
VTYPPQDDPLPPTRMYPQQQPPAQWQQDPYHQDPYHQDSYQSGSYQQGPYPPVQGVPMQSPQSSPPANYPVPYSPAPYPTSPYQPYQQVVIVQGPPTSGFAVASLVLGILGVLGGWCLFAIPCLLAVICGHVGLGATKNSARSGRGMAVAGLILGYLAIGPIIAILVVFGGIGGLMAVVAPTTSP